MDMTWHCPYKADMTDMFLPNKLEMSDVLERYQDGKFIDRTCSRSDFEWIRNGAVIANKLTRFNEAVRENLISDLGLWKGPFYPTSEVEFLLLAEYERVGKDEE